MNTCLLDNIAFVFVADCENPAPGNGTADTPVGSTYEDVAIIKCNDGYDLVGDTLISCLDGGNWSSSPSCAIKGSYYYNYSRTFKINEMCLLVNGFTYQGTDNIIFFFSS